MKPTPLQQEERERRDDWSWQLERERKAMLTGSEAQALMESSDTVEPHLVVTSARHIT